MHTPTRTSTATTATMFQSLAILILLAGAQTQAQAKAGLKDVVNAKANTNTNTNSDAAAVQLQATETSATPFGSKQLTRCRQSCYQQFARDWHYCTDFVDCRNCWQNCQRQLAPFELRVHHAQRQGALVLTDIGWDELIANASRQCLITWEVSGGGLMGNLLTDTARAELSLWPDTVYNIQVTCKHKLTGLMRRSLKLNVNTHELLASSSSSSIGGAATGAATSDHVSMSVSAIATVSATATSTSLSSSSSASASASSSSSSSATVRGTAKTTLLQRSSHPTDRVYIISALPTASQLSGVVYPAFGALAFFLALLVMFLFLRPQRKRTMDGDTDTASLLSGGGRRSSRLSMDNSTLHV